jgi:hypothetical protein
MEVEEEDEGPALEADTQIRSEGDKTGIHFMPITYQAIYEDDDYTRLLMVVIHIPNDIKGLQMVPNAEGTKLLITGVAPQLIADIDHMVAAEMLHNNFEIRGIKDALLSLHVPQSAYFRLFAKIELNEPVNHLSKVPYILTPSLMLRRLSSTSSVSTRRQATSRVRDSSSK